MTGSTVTSSKMLLVRFKICKRHVEMPDRILSHAVTAHRVKLEVDQWTDQIKPIGDFLTHKFG